jgi:ATPase subunit of ABC transporter with duplicated ATPase domains
MDNRELNRYVGDYEKFKEVYEMKKSQIESAYNRQQKEVAQLKDFVARTRLEFRPEIWLCPDRKNWIKWK